MTWRRWILLLLAAVALGTAIGVALARSAGITTDVAGFVAAWPREANTTSVVGLYP